MDLLAHLETFVAVADEQSFSRAAETLDMAQPLLSRRIKNLERTLGGALFDRSQRQIRVTDFGVVLLPHARDVLQRTRHLRSVAQSARAATVHALGVPPDCDPPALARLIRTAAGRGVAVSIHELPAQARETALAEGALVLALVRGPVETAPLVVPVGLACATPADAPERERPIHLDSLRPRRGASAGDPASILLMPEEDHPVFSSRLHRAMAAAGLPLTRARITSSTSSAAAEAMASADLLLCDERFAGRHGLYWRALADRSLHRGYELVIGSGRFGPAAARGLADWVTPLLATAVGAIVAGTAAPADDPRERLTVQA